MDHCLRAVVQYTRYPLPCVNRIRLGFSRSLNPTSGRADGTDYQHNNATKTGRSFWLWLSNILIDCRLVSVETVGRLLA